MVAAAAVVMTIAVIIAVALFGLLFWFGGVIVKFMVWVVAMFP